MPAKYKRVLLKLSGEVLLDRATGRCIDPAVVARMAAKVKAVKEMGADVAIVLGGGNICRGATGEELGIDRCAGDYMGMLARSSTPSPSRTRSRRPASRPAS